jgi:hypothetical protein
LLRTAHFYYHPITITAYCKERKYPAFDLIDMSGLVEEDAPHDVGLLKTTRQRQCLDISAIRDLQRTTGLGEEGADGVGISEEQRVLIEELTKAIDSNGYLYIRNSVLEESLMRYTHFAHVFDKLGLIYLPAAML